MEYSPKLALLLALASAMAAAVAAQTSPQDFVDPHNAARADVGVGPVSWDDTVAAYAQGYAEQRRGDCQLVHSGGQYGENIFWGSAGADWSAADAVNSWGCRRSSSTTMAATPARRVRCAATTHRWCGATPRPLAAHASSATTTAASSSSAATTRRATSWDRAHTDTSVTCFIYTSIYRYHI